MTPSQAGRSVPGMPLPFTIQDFANDLDAAKSFVRDASKETDANRQRNLALLAQACAEIAHAEATLLGQTP